MTHLGTHLSALVDGELSGTELDRANAHLAACEKCRGEAAAMRELKRQLRLFAADLGDCDLTSRLLAVAVSDESDTADRDSDEADDDLDQPRTAASPRGHLGGPLRARPAFRTYQEALDRPRRARAKTRRPPRSPRRRYFAWSAVSLAVVGGIGAAAFGMGGSSSPGPAVVPQVEVFNVEHAITSGDVPFPNTSLVPTTQTPDTANPPGTAKRAAQQQP